MPAPILVTGASSNHFKSLCQLVRSIRATQPEGSYQLRAWNLGLTQEEIGAFEAEFSTSLELFDYSKYPAFYSIEVAAGQYAWKSAILETVVADVTASATVILWLDAGNKITGSLDPLYRHIRAQGLYSPMSFGAISKYIHPLTLERTCHNIVEYRGKIMRNGAIIGFYAGAEGPPWVLSWFRRWRGWCATEAILAPEGSDRSNHLQDQALLTITYWEVQPRRGLQPLREFDMILTHQDVG